MPKPELLSRAKVLRVAAKKLPFRSDKALLQHLDFAGMDALEAYRCGAEEAQGHILERLEALRLAQGKSDG